MPAPRRATSNAVRNDADLVRRIGLADQGARGGRPAGTATASILEGKSPAEIVAMRRCGDRDGLLRGE